MNPSKPLHLKVLEGTDRKDRPTATATMGTAPMDKTPRPPATLERAGRSLWREKVQTMDELGVLSSMDLQTLEATCLAYEKFVAYELDCKDLQKRAQAFLEQNNMENYLICQKSAANAETACAKWLKIFKEYQEKLGWSPVDRQKVKAPPAQKEENPFLKLLQKRA